MHLSAEEQAIGKSNFATVREANAMTRRDFLVGTTAATAGVVGGLGAFYFGYHESLDRLKADPVRVGVIGTGDEGCVLIGAHTPELLDIVAIADIRPFNIHRAFHGDHSSPNALAVRPGLMSKRGWQSEDTAREHVKVYEDYRELLKDPNIEGVIIALPLHLHDVVAIEAMRSGKHVLTEKLMAHSVHQCKNMGRVSQKEKKILATGHQRHYSMLYADAVSTIQLGLLGDLHHIRAQWHRGNLPGRDSWQPDLPATLRKNYEKNIADLAKLNEELKTATGPDAAKKKKSVEDLLRRRKDLELKLLDEQVDAAKYDYRAYKTAEGYEVSPIEELIRWRLWNRTGGGLMAELGSHQLDAAGIFCSALRDDGQKAMPLSVSAVGGRYVFGNDREVDDHVFCTYEFPAPEYNSNPNKRIGVTYSSINGNGYGGYGEIVMGEKGTLILTGETEAMLFKGSNTTTHIKVAEAAGGTGPTLDTTASGPPTSSTSSKALSRGYTEEMEHWAWCIRNFDFEKHQPKCQPKVAMADAIIALVSNMAIANQQRIEFNPEWFDINSDATPEGIAPSESVG